MNASDRWTWARALAHSTYIPAPLRGKPGDIFFAAELATSVQQQPLDAIMAWDEAEMIDLLAHRYAPKPEPAPAAAPKPATTPGNPDDARQLLTRLAQDNQIDASELASHIAWATRGRTMDLEDMAPEEIEELARTIQEAEKE